MCRSLSHPWASAFIRGKLEPIAGISRQDHLQERGGTYTKENTRITSLLVNYGRQTFDITDDELKRILFTAAAPAVRGKREDAGLKARVQPLIGRPW